jgi:methanogenic corrinoid protein MtbC1
MELPEVDVRLFFGVTRGSETGRDLDAKNRESTCQVKPTEGTSLKRLESIEPSLDLDQFRKAAMRLDLLASRLPRDAVQALADEAIGRMAASLRPVAPTAQVPSPAQIDELCSALLSRDLDAGAAAISQLEAERVSIEEIYTVYLAATARRMGELWEKDQISFSEVTVGASRILAIMRSMREAHISKRRLSTRSALFAAVPDEQHTIGITMAADLFRREDWDIELIVGAAHEEIIDRVRRSDALVIGLTAHGLQSLTALLKLIVAIRIVNPAIHVLVCGAIVDGAEDILDLTGADGFVTDVPSALVKMSMLHDMVREAPAF